MERMASAAALGASTMFVSVVLGLRGSPLFSPDTKDNHPRILFPLYYTFEFWLLGIGLGEENFSMQPRRRWYGLRPHRDFRAAMG